MRVAHLIMAHKNPSQVLRLVKRLNHSNFDIFVHVDAKVDIEQFKILNSVSNLSFIHNRSDCNWGGFSLFQSIINCVKEVLSSPIEYDFINMISGQDYPLYNSQYIYNYLMERKETIFLSFEDSSDSEWWKQAATRYEKYHFTDFNIKGKYLIERIVNLFAPKRKFPEKLELFGGNKSCWWTLTNESAKYVIDKLESSPKLLSFLKLCWGTDEFVIPTLIMNSPLKYKVVNDNLRYIDWTEGNAHPKLLGEENFAAISESKMLFARKFDTEVDCKILDQIDKLAIEVA
jgi:hypothetical protein